MIFVIGPPCAGKSEFIKNTFPDKKVLDLYEVQYGENGVSKDGFLSYEDCLKSYEILKDNLVRALKNKEDIILEHTLLLSKRRPMYIDAVRSVSDEPVDVYAIVPDENTYIKFQEKRDVYPDLEALKMFEIPKQEEGFRNIYIVKPMIQEEK